MTYNITGKIFGRLQVIEPIYVRKEKRWKCLCACGKETIIRTTDIVRNITKSCGCLQKEVASATKQIDIAGERFGSLVVIQASNKRNHSGSIKWLCKCNCGKYIEVSGTDLRRRSTNCGCSKVKNIAGNNYGRLTAITPLNSRTGNGNVVWLCKCLCGNNVEVGQCYLARGNTQSCGCLTKSGIRDVYFYVFRSVKHNLIKFGIAGNVIKRKNHLEIILNDTLDIVNSFPSSKAYEKKIHMEFKKYRAVHPSYPKGKEWYLDSIEIEKFIKCL